MHCAHQTGICLGVGQASPPVQIAETLFVQLPCRAGGQSERSLLTPRRSASQPRPIRASSWPSPHPRSRRRRPPSYARAKPALCPRTLPASCVWQLPYTLCRCRGRVVDGSHACATRQGVASGSSAHSTAPGISSRRLNRPCWRGWTDGSDFPRTQTGQMAPSSTRVALSLLLLAIGAAANFTDECANGDAKCHVPPPHQPSEVNHIAILRPVGNFT